MKCPCSYILLNVFFYLYKNNYFLCTCVLYYIKCIPNYAYCSELECFFTVLRDKPICNSTLYVSDDGLILS